MTHTRVPNINKTRLTFAYFWLYIAIGVGGTTLGPSLIALAQQTQSTLSAISILFVAGAMGRITGAILGARTFDRWQGNRIIAVCLLIMAGGLLVIPFIALLYIIAMIEFVRGIAETTLDVGGNTLLVWLHGKNVAPYMNGIHLFFGLGAFLTPFMMVFGLSFDRGLIVPYSFAALFLALPCLLLWFLPSPSHPAPLVKHQHRRQSQSIMWLLAFIFFVGVGVEVAYNGWVFNFGVANGFSNANAGLLNSVFWGTFTLGRLIAIPISLRLSTRRYLFADFVLGMAGALILLALPQFAWAIWFGVGLVGLAIASIFPVLMSYAERNLTITGNVTGVFFAAANLSAMALPWFIGQFFESFGASVLNWVMFVSMCLALAALWVLGRVGTKKHMSSEK
jgi:FHS family Na+ dependent glucose MFS transporter 1